MSNIGCTSKIKMYKQIILGRNCTLSLINRYKVRGRTEAEAA